MPMAPLESWLSKVRSAVSSAAKSSGAPPPGPKKSKKSSVGILTFEVASLMSKLLHMWRGVGDAAVARLRHETINLDGVRKVVSDDDDFLLGLACAELVDALRAASESVAALAARCADPSLREFGEAFLEFADTGRDRHRWVASSWKEMETRAHKMEKLVASTTALRRAMEELAEAEHGLRKQHLQMLHLSASKISVAAEQQQLVFSKKQEVKQLKQTSVWGCTFDAIVASLARSAFTTLARIKLVFDHPREEEAEERHQPLYRSLTFSSAVHPSSSMPPPPDQVVVTPRRRSSMSSMELLLLTSTTAPPPIPKRGGSLTPPPGTLGADALAPRYAGVVISIERMARSPRTVGPDERDELYAMLPASVRSQLRARLRGAVAAADPGLAGQWRAALAGILDWLAPMAHATMRWQAERSFFFQRTNTTTKEPNVLLLLLLQTLHFADRDKVEAAVAELLVGLNYVWRFDNEMSCRALFAVHRQQLLMDDTANANGTVSSCA